MIPFYVDMARIVRVEEFLAELARVVAWEVLVLYMIDHMMFLGASLLAFQTLKQVGINFLEAQIHKIHIS